MPQITTSTEHKSTCNILKLLLTSILIIFTICFTIFWIIVYNGSFVWDDSTRHSKLTNFPIKFNFHPLLMTGGLIGFSGFSTLTYRFCSNNKLTTKLIHTILHTFGIVTLSLGLLIIYECKENSFPVSVEHFYSVHSWFGLATIGLIAFQFTVGFLVHILLLLCEKSTAKLRKFIHPFHTTLGLLILIIGTITILIGLVQTNVKQRSYERYNLRNDPETLVINILGSLFVVVLLFLVWVLK